VNLAPRSKICPLGARFTPSFTPSFTPRSPPGVNTLLFRRMEGQTEFHTQGITSPLGDKIHPWGSKFAPRGKVKNGPQIAWANPINFAHLKKFKCYLHKTLFDVQHEFSRPAEFFCVFQHYFVFVVPTEVCIVRLNSCRTTKSCVSCKYHFNQHQGLDGVLVQPTQRFGCCSTLK
jgi:hypothetical protein